MAIKFGCPRCGKRLSVSSDYAGKEGKCKCGAALIVPGDSDRMKFKCTQCGGGISVRKTHAGKKGKCPTCQNAVTVPLLGTLAGGVGVRDQDAGAKTGAAAVPVAMISFECPMCLCNVEVRQSSAGKITECPTCSSDVEVPGGDTDPYGEGTATVGIGPGIGDMEAGGQAIVGTGRVVCPSCQRKLGDSTPVCTRCGIYIKSGRPILTAWNVDPDELEDKAHGVVKYISWLIPFGIYPVYSEALGVHKPYATWGIVAVTVLVSIWFSALQLSGSTQMRPAKNLMLWGGDAKPDPQLIRMLYERTNYGDAEAYYAKREALKGTMPRRERDVAALEALTPEQRCFGEYRHVQLITHAFLHGGIILHLAGNMLFFLVFGTRVNAAIGNVLMVIMYPILAIAAALTYLAMLGAEPPTASLGASGAVMGLAGAYLLLYPAHKIYMVIWIRWLFITFRLSFKCFAVRGFWVVLFYIMFDVIAVWRGQNTGTAHWAHIGGLVWGFVIAYGLLAGRVTYSGGDVVSLVLGKHAWRIIGTPHSRRK